MAGSYHINRPASKRVIHGIIYSNEVTNRRSLSQQVNKESIRQLRLSYMAFHRLYGLSAAQSRPMAIGIACIRRLWDGWQRKSESGFIFLFLFSVLDSAFLNVAPSKLAAAIFNSVRARLNVCSTWSARLKHMFGYELDDLHEVMGLISE